MNIERLVRMANDIGNFFKAEPDHEVAVDSVAAVGSVRRAAIGDEALQVHGA